MPYPVRLTRRLAWTTHRVSAGLSAHEAGHKPVPAPTTRPIGRTEPAGQVTVALHIVDEATPHKTAKPHGIHGCEVYSHVGDTAPVEPSGYTFLGLTTRTPFKDTHDAADAGKTALSAALAEHEGRERALE